MAEPWMASELELLRAIERGRVDHEVQRRADDMFRFCVLLMRRLGGTVTLTFDELMSKTDDVEIVYEQGGIRDPLEGHRIWLTTARPRNTPDQHSDVQAEDVRVLLDEAFDYFDTWFARQERIGRQWIDADLMLAYQRLRNARRIYNATNRTRDKQESSR